MPPIMSPSGQSALIRFKRHKGKLYEIQFGRFNLTLRDLWTGKRSFEISRSWRKHKQKRVDQRFWELIKRHDWLQWP